MENRGNYRRSSAKRNFAPLPKWALLILLLYSHPYEGYLLAQDTDKKDTVTTPFRKGRWLSGLSGSFSSNVLRLDTRDELLSTNSYGLEIFTGIFFKDRWFAGINVYALSSSGAGLVERESESLIIGPSVNYYFLKEHYGSLYVSVLPGYIRFREENLLEVEDQISRQIAEGPGFTTRIRLGYSYVISRQIVLDVGVGTNFAWLDVSYRSDIQQVDIQESIFSNATSFSFGFNVLLDEFFF